MEDSYKLFDAEYKLMKIIWKNEPINSTSLVKTCNELLGWKKSTTYTMLKKLKDRNIIKSENAIVSSLVRIEEVKKYESEKIIHTTFDDSLPRFLVSFLDGKKISVEEAEELKLIIDQYKD